MYKLIYTIQIVVIFVLVLCHPFIVIAAPSIDSVSQSGSTYIITGTDFGTKTPATPVYWNNLESETTGETPSGWTIRTQPGGITSTDDSWSGSKSLYFAMKTNNPNPGWCELLRDLGSGSAKWYFHWKTRFIQNDSNETYQWKSWRISSSSDGYAWNTESTTTVFMNDLFWFWPDYELGNPGWSGPSGVTYNDGGTSGNSAGIYFEQSDAILFDTWQTLEQYLQQGSPAGTNNGIAKMWRDGILVQTNTALDTGLSTSGLWRYILLGQDINNTTPTAGEMDVDIYYDDIYIDNTQSRVMMCAESTWANRSVCEIQPPTAWADGQIIIDSNQGRFSVGQTVYVYVFDSDGVANADGKRVVLSGLDSPLGGNSHFNNIGTGNSSINFN